MVRAHACGCMRAYVCDGYHRFTFSKLALVQELAKLGATVGSFISFGIDSTA